MKGKIIPVIFGVLFFSTIFSAQDVYGPHFTSFDGIRHHYQGTGQSQFDVSIFLSEGIGNPKKNANFEVCVKLDTATDTRTVPIEIVALNLESCQPITVGGQQTDLNFLRVLVPVTGDPVFTPSMIVDVAGSYEILNPAGKSISGEVEIFAEDVVLDILACIPDVPNTCESNNDCESGTVCRDGLCQSPCDVQCIVPDPVCGEDGNTYWCGQADAACHGVDVAHDGACGDVCLNDQDCEVGEICGPTSVCESCACPEIYDPVCGVDDQTYENSCQARCAHVDVKHTGPCQTTCESNNDCESGTVCRDGICQSPCDVLCIVPDPVCGEDGNTYWCGQADAACHGVDVAHDGACGGVCLNDQDCDDENPGTTDSCVENACVHEPVPGFCTSDSECDDGNVCTLDTCNPTDPNADSNGCVVGPDPNRVGQACGSQVNTACDNPNTCDNNGACNPNYEPAGTQCGTNASCDGTGVCQTTCPEPRVCGTATLLGAVRGDVGADTLTFVGSGAQWFRVGVIEADTSSTNLNDLSVLVRLETSPGTDYDLLAHCDSCSSPVAVISNNPPGSLEQVTLRWNEEEVCILNTCFPSTSDSGRPILIEVRNFSTLTCDEFRLTVIGNQLSGGPVTCSPR